MSTMLRLLGMLLLLVLLASPAQAQAWQSVQGLDTSIGGTSLVDVTAVDAAGNVYLAGRFTHTIQLGTITLSSANQTHIFIAKWNTASRTFVWAVQTGGSGDHDVSKLVVSGNSIYVAGGFLNGTVSFGGTVLAGSGFGSAFVAKLVDTGTSVSFGWAQQIANNSGTSVSGLAVDGASLYLTGSFRTNTLVLGSFALPCAGGTDLFIAKLVDSGTTASYTWAQRAGSSADELAEALVLANTSLYMTGGFVGTITLGNTTLTVSNTLGSSLFVAKLTDTGSGATYDWSRAASGPDMVSATAVAVNGSSVYVAGSFAGATATFGTITLANAGATGYRDIFVAKLTDVGTSASYNWVQRAGGTDTDEALSLLVRGSRLYLAGWFRSFPASFGSLSLFSTPDSSNPGLYSLDLFVTCLLDAGTTSSFAWAQSAGSADYDYCGGLVLLDATLYLGGGAHLPATFGSQALSGTGNTIMSFLATIQDAILPTRAGTTLAEDALYPNPAHATATVRIPAGTGVANLTLLDALGRVVRTQVAQASTNVTFDLTGLVPGVYALRVRAGEVVATQKLIVE